MCDFKPGDEVVCVASDPTGRVQTVVGRHYTISHLGWHGPACVECGSTGVCDIEELPIAPLGLAYCVCHFRKVERKTDRLNLTEWLSQPTDFEEPKRAPAKKRESA